MNKGAPSASSEEGQVFDNLRYHPTAHCRQPEKTIANQWAQKRPIFSPSNPHLGN